MKKLLLLLTVCLIAFSGCKKDEEDENKTPNFFQVKINYTTDDVGPKGTIVVFDIRKTHPKENKIFGGMDFYYMEDVNGDKILPIYQKKFEPSKNSTTGVFNNYSIISVYWYELSTAFYGAQSPGTFLVGIYLKDAPFSHTYKVVDWTEDFKILKTFSLTEDENTFVEWTEAQEPYK